ncbi:MAG: hypothetical protein RPU72_03675 [Candidatus Sedimenticola sp. (ex Thyasira tokunagai)]
MLKFSLWTLLGIIAFEVAIAAFVNTPTNNTKPSKLVQYFDYGRSIESKIIRMAGTNNSNADPLLRSGWFADKNTQPIDPERNINTRQVFIYGMSFSNHIGKILSDLDKTLNIQMFAGPGAPLNHSYSYYINHRPHNEGDIVILGVLASSLPRINTLTHMTGSFERPAGHFYPRYRLNKNNLLVKNEINISSLRELRESIHDPQQWGHVKRILSEYDSYYDPIIFEQQITDYSVYARLLKRAWGQRNSISTIQSYHDRTGFKNSDRMVEVARSLVSDFATKVRADKAIPYVILFNNRGYDDHLYKIMRPILTEEKIPYYSTHQEFPTTQLSNFRPDGHFTPEVDHMIAKTVLKEIQKLAGSYQADNLRKDDG